MKNLLLSFSCLLLIGCGQNTLVSDLTSAQFVDLTHSFEPGIPHHPLLPNSSREVLFDHDTAGFLVEKFCHVGQWGTHIDPPIHFIKDTRALDEIRLDEMILPLVVIDVHEKAQENHDYQITMDDVRDWEAEYGLVPSESFVAMRTDWHERWPSSDAMQNFDDEGIKHYPGWSKEVLEYFLEERGVTAIGHEPTDTDPGISTSNNDYSLEYYVLAEDRYQIELLTNLDEVPEHGAAVIVAFPKAKGGSGFPARVIAVVPR